MTYIDVERVVGEIVERDIDGLGQPEGVVEARAGLALEDPGDLGIAHLRKPGKLLPVEAMPSHQDLELIFEFHVSTVRRLPDTGKPRLSKVQDHP